MLAGQRTLGGKQALVLARWSAAGETIWQRAHHYEGQANIVAVGNTLLPLADGGFALAGLAIFGGSAAGVAIVRSDPSGYVSCQDAGLCSALATDSCDDGNPCTVDWCDAKTKCKHASLDGVGCGLGGICSAGVCKAP